MAMISNLPLVEDLPRQAASQAKNKWAELTRLVRQRGTVAITNHSEVEMVVIDVAAYEKLTSEIQALKAHEQNVLDELAQRFEERLADLQAPESREKVAALLQRKGGLTRRPKAGETY
jgi:prevent-host-death family protein